MRRSHPAGVPSGQGGPTGISSDQRGAGPLPRARSVVLGHAGPLPRARSLALGRLLLAGAVAVAGATALVGNRRATPAEVQGTPLDPASRGDLDPRRAETADRGGRGDHPEPGRAVAPALAVGSIADLLDLDQWALTADGAHYEAPLKDGRRAVLTLDPALQALAEKLLAEARAPRGAIVVMAPDGRILALAGRRSDPPARDGAKDAKGAGDPAKPHAHDAVSDWRLATDVWAPAASVFKLVTASALVAAGVDPSDKVCFHGGLRSVLPSNLQDDKRDSRCESLMYGVAHSNNAILGKLAFQKLEPDALVKLAHTLGVADALPGD